MCTIYTITTNAILSRMCCKDTKNYICICNEMTTMNGSVLRYGCEIEFDLGEEGEGDDGISMFYATDVLIWEMK